MAIDKHDFDGILREINRAVNSSMDPVEISRLVLKELRKAMASDHASLFLVDDKSGHLVLYAADGFNEDEMDNLKLIGKWKVIDDCMIWRREPIAIDDIYEETVSRIEKLPFSEDLFPMRSLLSIPLETRGRVTGAFIISNSKRAGCAFTDEDKRLLSALSNNIAVSLQNARQYCKMKNFFLSAISSLTREIDAKDDCISGHSERVMRYTVAIGREMALEDEALESLRLASLLHDIGKIGVKESILMKPAKLLGYERRQIRMHPTIGARMVESMDDSHAIRRGILEHHERYDGKGYPHHLKGEQISIEGRIIAVADVFDALTTDRPYQKGRSREDIFRKIQEESSSQFDPRVVEAFVSSYKNCSEIWRDGK